MKLLTKFNKKIHQLTLLFLIGISVNISSLELNINRSYQTKEIPKANLYVNIRKPLFFRLYRIDNFSEYLSGQKNSHKTTVKHKRIGSGGFAMINSFSENFKWNMFQVARKYMHPNYRKKIIEGSQPSIL